MKFSKFCLATSLASLLLISNAMAELKTDMHDFGESLRLAIPETLTQNNIWSDAYIGQVYPSIFPHMGFGLGLGVTKLDTSGISNAASELGMTSSVNKKFILPTLSIDARFGGFILPFDFGVSGMMTSPMLFGKDMNNSEDVLKNGGLDKLSFKGFFNAVGSEIWVDYLTLGGDFRYRFVENDGFIPSVSIGAGYYYTRGLFRVFENDKKIGTSYENHTIFLQVQASNEWKIFSGFIGIRGLVSNSTTKGAWTSDGTIYDSTEVSELDGKWNWKGVQPQVYTGFSVDIYHVELTFGLCCDVRSFYDKSNYKENLLSGSFSIRYNL